MFNPLTGAGFFKSVFQFTTALKKSVILFAALSFSKVSFFVEWLNICFSLI